MELDAQKDFKVDTKLPKHFLALLDVRHRQVSSAPLTFFAHPCVDGEGIRSLTKRVQSLLEPVSDIRPELEPPVHRYMVLKCFHSIAMMLSPPPPPHFFPHKLCLTFSTEEKPRRLQTPFIYLYDRIPTLPHGLSKKECLTNPETPILIRLIRPWGRALMSCRQMWFYQQWLSQKKKSQALQR